MKKFLFNICLVILCVLTLTACNSNKIKEDTKKAKERAENLKKEETESADSVKFKEEYESYNGKKSSSGQTIRSLEIAKNNPFVYKTDSDIVKLIEDKETFIVYFGFPTCPWCRSVLPSLISVAKDYNVDKIYYVNVKDIRDTLKLNKKGKVITETKGTDAYYKLLDKFDDVLSDYKLKDSKDRDVKTGEKRIYAPNVIVVIDGEAKALATGISDKQTDGYMKLTDEMEKDSYNAFEEVIKVYANENASCDVKGDKC